MLKSILSLKGAQGLTVNEQKSIQGGADPTNCRPGESLRCYDNPFTGEYICGCVTDPDRPEE